jgi:Zn-dependent metalloprotease
VSANGRGGLTAAGESGALNEAIADCMSVATDFYINGDSVANWQIADGVTGNGVPNMRDLSNPKMSGGGIFNSATLSYPQPDTYEGENWVDPTNMNYDNGGIHFNNGVFNYWFYLLTEGGSGVNDNKQSYEVEGIGIEKTEKLLMHIILNYLTPEMGYHRMRIVSQYAAIELWGQDSEELAQVHNAWFAVGVADKTPVEDVEEKLLNVYAANGNIVVEAEENSMIDVYSIVGQHLVSVEAESGFTTIPMAEHSGVVIVKVGDKAQKVVIK